jgi:hypothetical protein
VTESPLALLERIVVILDDLGIPYVLGGSMASSVMGEPRSTMDVDVAVELDAAGCEALLARVRSDFYVPEDAAREAIAACGSFNLIDESSAMKVDVFVLGTGLLDVQQMKRRRQLSVAGVAMPLWVTAVEDQVLRKLAWFRDGGETSDRQWRDVLGLLRINQSALDLEYLTSTAGQVGLSDLLARAIEAGHQ